MILLKLLCKPKELQKIKAISFMKVTIVTVVQFTLVNLNGQMNTKDLSGIAIVIRIKMLNTAGKQIITLIGIRRVFDRESSLIPRKIKETIYSLKNPDHINKISYMLPEIWLPNLW